MPDATPRPQDVSDSDDVRLNKDFAAFGYIWIMSVVVFAAKPRSSFARFHSKQGIVLFLCSLLGFLPWIGAPISLLAVAGMILGFIHAARGERMDVPIAGPLSRGDFSSLDLTKLWPRSRHADRSPVECSHEEPVRKSPPQDIG